MKTMQKKYQLQLESLGKGLLYDFIMVFAEEFKKELEILCSDLNKQSVVRFNILKESVLDIDQSDLRKEIPEIWHSCQTEEEVYSFYKALDFEDIFLDNLVNTFLYYKKIVSKYLTPKSTMLALQVEMSISNKVFNTSSVQIFDHYQSHPDLLETYAKGFVGSHLSSDIQFVKTAGFKKDQRILDIGGGFGHLGELLRKFDIDSPYDVLDLQGLYNIFKTRIKKNEGNFSDFRFISSNFFLHEGEIPELGDRKYDVIILGWILHDWNDKQCLELLKKIKKHLNKNGKIFILENVSDKKTKSFSFLDWVIFVMANGHERLQEDYLKLIEKAGLSLENVNNNFNRSVLCAMKK